MTLRRVPGLGAYFKTRHTTTPSLFMLTLLSDLGIPSTEYDAATNTVH